MKTQNTICLIMCMLLFLVAGFTSVLAQQIINENGDFSDAAEGQTEDITNWFLEGTDHADFEVVEDPDDPENLVLRVTLTDIADINAWDVQAIHQNTMFVAANDYEISFRVRGEQDGTVQLDGGTGAQLWGQEITGGEWHTLQTGQFSPDEDGTRQIAVHFAHENNEDGLIFYIDDIEVREYADDGNGDNGENLYPEPPYAVGDIINYNGSFQHSDLGETEPVAWTVSTGAGSVAEVVDDAADGDDRALEFTIDWTGNTNWWENEVVNEPINVAEGDVYRISGSFKADEEGRIVRFYLGMPESGGWERARGWDTPELELTTDWQEFEFEHTITANNENHGMRAGVEFNAEVNDGGTIFIDDVRVTKKISEDELNSPVIVDAESGELGDEWEVLDEDGVEYIVITTDFDETTGTAAYPGENRTASYSVTFPAEGEYDLFARVRVGPQAFDDDSFFEPNGFGEKDPSNSDDWFNVNGLAAAGFNDPDAVVRDQPGGLGSEVWKWVNVSQNAFQGDTTQSFHVEGELTKTFQIGAREDGQDIDKFAFGRSELFFTVANLDNVEPGSVTDPRQAPTPTPPIADGHEKFLGNIYSSAQIEDFEYYWNQVTPENAGKWGSVEGTRDVMNWGELDNAYNLAKDNDFPFRFHVLVWGGQQPGWINDLEPEEQLEEITEWFEAVAERYPDIDYLEVVNEGSNNHQLPDGVSGEANYIEALGGTGDTGHDWIITAFEMARDIFGPDVKLMINDYGIVGNTTATGNYLTIIEDLQERELIDVIGVQAHAFSTSSSSSQIETTLDMLGETGLPIQATEMDIDGDPNGTDEESDQLQLQRIQRIFPLFWEHPSVEGVTFWGWRPGLWRQDQDAFLIRNTGEERPALEWLREYVEGTVVSNERTGREDPLSFKLHNNYPNPFNPTTQIRYDIAQTTDVSVRVYDLLGRQVQTLVNTQQSPGSYTVTFDASNLSSGVYFYRIETGSFVDTKQMLLIK